MQASSSFQTLGLPANLLKSLAKMNFQDPTPIQAQAIPLALQGRDIIGCAQTGTGKTGAFVIPLVALLNESPEKTALILTPTRELALQIFEVAKNMTWFEKKWGIALLIGGSSYGPQFQQLRQKPRLVIGTPGRVQDHVDQRSLRLDKTGFLVLDEADRMLDMGFAPQIESILESVPNDRQTFLFTATLPREIERMCGKFMRNPERITVGENSRPVDKIKQEVIETVEARKLEALFTEIQKREGSMLIFAKTKRRTERLTQELEDSGFEVASIHGDRSQRQRSDAIRDFRKGHARILVATDVAARGLDVPHIAHVINFDLPQVPEDFVHRIGRTARAGAEGAALTFVTPSERGMWRRIQYLINPVPARRERPSRSLPPVGQASQGAPAPRREEARPERPRFFERRQEERSERSERPERPFRKPRFENDRPQRGFQKRTQEEGGERGQRSEKRFEQRSSQGGPRRNEGPQQRRSSGFRSFNPAGGGSEEPQRRFGGRRPARKGGFRKFSALDKNEESF